MTPTPSDAQPVAYRSRWSGDSQWGLHLSPRLIRGDDAEDFIQEPLVLKSALDAERQQREAAERELERFRGATRDTLEVIQSGFQESERLRLVAEASLAKAIQERDEARSDAEVYKQLLDLSRQDAKHWQCDAQSARAALSNIEKERDHDR